jgi:PAS domain S-box-containing protein
MQKKAYEHTLEDIFIVDSENIYENEIIQQCFDVVGAFVVAINMNGKITFANNTAAEMLEYSKKELIGLNFIEHFIIEPKQKQTKEFFELVINGKSYYKENSRFYIQGKKKQQRIIESKNVTIRDKSNHILGILISGRDVTDFVFKQKDLQTDLSLYRLLANNIPDINLFIFDKNLQFILAEGNEMKNNDLNRDDFEQNTLYEFPDKDLRKIWIPLFESALRGKESSAEYQFNNYHYNIWVLPVYTRKNKIFTGVAITQNITEDKQIKRKLRKSKEEAERANQSKTDFLARVSHEIRTPLNAILGFAEQLKQSKLTNSQEEYVNIINKSSEHLLSLINDILVLSKIEAGQIRFDKTPFKLTYTIEYLYKAMLVKAREKQIDFTYHIDKSLDQVLLGDQFRLRQILINMLSNAIKFTNSGSVKLNCFLDEERKDAVKIKFEVIDTGIGINPKNLKTIFKRFKQADPSITKTYGGTGLGLSICKNLIELQAGSLSIASEKNVGSTFTFTIPYKKGQPKDMVPEDLGNIDSNTLRGKQVLLVDDDNFNRILAKTILEKFGCEIAIAVNGSEAIRFIDKQNFDIILLDIHMSEVSGLDVAEFIRKKQQDQKTKILAVTAAVLKDDINSYFRVGINDFLIKPFKEVDLFNKMCEVLNLRDKNTKNEVEHTILEEKANVNLYDLSELLRMADGNQKFVNDMLVTFIENTENTVLLFKQFLKEQNWKQIGETAHKIIPAYKHLQVNSVVKKLIELKNITLEEKDHKLVPDLTKKAINNMEELLKYLKKEID